MEHVTKEQTAELLSGLEINLSEFAFFLSVMKNKEAYESVLSIIMEEVHLKLAEVKVEEVVLNKIGKRAIRLDAWAIEATLPSEEPPSCKEVPRQFIAEIQNTIKDDDVRKRSRFYQGLLDSPILKSGKKTKYKNLPSTVIIFITQNDIWKRDIAKYTFTEQCKEITGQELEDGTQKIFLNMTSMNGTPELISLLQYMKDTRIENPNIIVKDQRIMKLDEIVTETKQSEEWEVVQMNILEIGIQKGQEQGIEQGIQAFIADKFEEGVSTKIIQQKLERHFQLTEEQASAYLDKYLSTYAIEA